MDDASVTNSALSDESALISEVTTAEPDANRDREHGSALSTPPDMINSTDSLALISEIGAVMDHLLSAVEEMVQDVERRSVDDPEEDVVQTQVADVLPWMVATVELEAAAPAGIPARDDAVDEIDQEVTAALDQIISSIEQQQTPPRPLSPSRFGSSSRSGAHRSDNDLDAAEAKLNSPRLASPAVADRLAAEAHRRDVVLQAWSVLTVADQWRMKSAWQLDREVAALHAECVDTFAAQLEHMVPPYVWGWYVDQSQSLDHLMAQQGSAPRALPEHASRLMEWTLMIVELLENYDVDAQQSSQHVPLTGSIRDRVTRVSSALDSIPLQTEVLRSLDDMTAVVDAVHHVADTVCADFYIQLDVAAVLDDIGTVIDVTHSLVDEVVLCDDSMSPSSAGVLTPALPTSTATVPPAAVSTVLEADVAVRSLVVTGEVTPPPLSDPELDSTSAPQRVDSGVRAELKSQTDHALQNDLHISKSSEMAAASSLDGDSTPSGDKTTDAAVHDHSEGWCQACTRRSSKSPADRGMCASADTCILC